LLQLLPASRVDGDAAGLFLLLLVRIVRGQVGRDAVPALAVIARTEQKLRADVDRALLVRRERDRRVPVPAQLFVVVRLRLDRAYLVRVPVDARDRAALVLGVDVVRIGRVLEHPEAVAAVHVLPARVRDAAGIGAVADPGTVVLQAAVHVERIGLVDADVVELRHRQVVLLPPLVAAVVRLPEAAVVTGHDVLRVRRIDPDVVIVAVHAAAGVGEALAAVEALDQVEVRLEETVRIFRIDDEVGEIERPPDHQLALVALVPGLAAVIGAIQRRIGRLDERVDDVRRRWRDRDGETAERLLRKTLVRRVGDFGPCFSAVRRTEQAASRRLVRRLPARAERPALAPEVPERGEDRVRVLRVETDRRTARRKVLAFQHK
jgi:hypothetical protein